MSEPFVFSEEGFFWANDPDRRVRGRVALGPHDGRLDLEQPLRLDQSIGADQLSAIHGETLLREPLCLLDSFVSKAEMANVQYVQSWTVNAALVGTDQPQAQVTAVKQLIDGLDSFYGYPQAHPISGTDSHGRATLEIQWTSAGTTTVELGNQRLLFDDDYTFDGKASDFRFKSVSFARVDTDEPTAPKELRAILDRLQLLTAICQNRPVAAHREDWTLPDGSTVVYWSPRREIVERSKPKRPWLALGNLAPLDASLPKWVALGQELPGAFVMLHEYAQAGASTTWDDRLLYLARFIEQYHRARFKSLRMPKEDFNGRRAEVKRLLTPELAAWVDGLIAGGNERRLAERLTELVESVGQPLAPVIRDATAWGQAVADTRNYLTHYSERSKKKAAREMELVTMTLRLWMVIRACLLKELGLDSAGLAEALRLDSEFAWLASQP